MNASETIPASPSSPRHGIRPVAARRRLRPSPEALEARIAPATALAVTDANALLQFDTANPGVVKTTPITGLVGGDNVLGIDFRPTTGELFALGSGNRLYVIDPGSGAATLRFALTADPADASNPFAGLQGTAFGVDFNPVPDLGGLPSFRVISNADENLRINVTNGQVTTDTAITPTGLSLDAVAYTNVDTDAATGTTIFAYDFLGDDLVTSGAPNGGVYSVVGDSGVVTSLQVNGFDIQTVNGVNTGFAALKSGEASHSSLYTINLATGAATLAGQIGSAAAVRGLSIVPEFVSTTLFAISSGNTLLRFNAGAPGAATTVGPITGLVANDVILGFDFRPTTGVAYVVGSTTLYTLDTATGAATVVATLSAAPGDDNPFTGFAAGIAAGVGFNPVPDLAGNPSLRVVTDVEQNLRINVANGQVTTDTNITGATNLTSVAYTNNDLDPATGTTIFGYDFLQDDVVTSANPNGGVYTDVGDSGLLVANTLTGFDIQTLPGGINNALAAFTANVTVGLYSINLATGAATALGQIGNGSFLNGMAVAAAGSFSFSAPTYSVGESGPVATITINRAGGSSGVATVQFSTGNGTATSPGDFTDSDQTVIFGPGVTSRTVTIPINGDDFNEPDETVNLTLANPTGGALLAAQATAVLTITNDDTLQNANAFGLDAAGNLVRFNTAAPGTIVSSLPVTGLVGDDTILAIDIRPATGELFALGSGSRLYTIDKTTGAAAQVGADVGFTLSGTSFGFDFNPTVDRIRVVSDADQNIRLNPNNGTLVDFDAAAAGTQPDLTLIYNGGDLNFGANPSVVGAAYSNSVNLATTTTLYGIDSATDSLVIQSPPNNGVLNTVGALGVDATDVLGFDIRGATNGALATLVVGGTPGLYSINLATGAATFLGPVGAGLTLRGLAIAAEGFTGSLLGSTATFTGSSASDAIVFDQAGGLLRHNRFSAGDPGFSSDFDFDPNTAGDQTLSASDAAVEINVSGGAADDRVSIGSAAASASTLAAYFSISGGGGGDTLTVEDGGTFTDRSLVLSGPVILGFGNLIQHSGLERVNINAGLGSDTINITGTTLAPTSLNAGGGGDTVIFANGASLSGGVLDGGAGRNSLDYSAWTTGVFVDLSAAQAQTLFLAMISSAQEPGPLSTSQASGTGVFTLNSAQTALTFNMTTQGVVGATITGNHLHNAPAGVNGPIVRGLTPAEEVDNTPPGTALAGVWTSTDAAGTGGVASSGPLTPALVTELLAGRIYFNQHTNLFPSGELRGQLISQGTVGAATGTGGARNFAHLTGGSGGDTLVGDETANVIIGNAGDDTLGGGSDGDNLTGGTGNDTLRLNPLAGTTTVTGGNDLDTISFATSALPVAFDLDLVGAQQAVAGNNARVLVTDLLENFTGSRFNDVINIDAQPFARTIDGGPHPSVPPGDRLNVDARGGTASINKSDANTGTVSVTGYGLISFDEVETVLLQNSPSTGGFPPGGGAQAFLSATIHPTGTLPRAVATGDLNGDGFDDIVTANAGRNTVSVLFNAGNGTFLFTDTHRTGGIQPGGVALGDFDGDGDLDIAVTNQRSSTVAILTGGGNGSFTFSAVFKTAAQPLAIETADLNGDGDLDLVVAATASHKVSVLLGTGAGSGFGPAQNYASGGLGPRELVIADFNDDTNLDVAVVNSRGGTVGLLPGTGTGGFTPVVRFAVGSRPTSIAAGDFNNDGNLDLVVSHAGSPFMSFLAGNGSAFAAQFTHLRVTYPLSRGPVSVVAGDFNGDGNLDVALANSRLPTLSILLGTGNGTFSQPFDIPVGGVPRPVPYALALADFNNDGALDIVAATVASNSVSVLLRHTAA